MTDEKDILIQAQHILAKNRSKAGPLTEIREYIQSALKTDSPAISYKSEILKIYIKNSPLFDIKTEEIYHSILSILEIDLNTSTIFQPSLFSKTDLTNILENTFIKFHREKNLLKNLLRKSEANEHKTIEALKNLIDSEEDLTSVNAKLKIVKSLISLNLNKTYTKICLFILCAILGTHLNNARNFLVICINLQKKDLLNKNIFGRLLNAQTSYANLKEAICTLQKGDRADEDLIEEILHPDQDHPKELAKLLVALPLPLLILPKDVKKYIGIATTIVKDHKHAETVLLGAKELIKNLEKFPCIENILTKKILANFESYPRAEQLAQAFIILQKNDCFKKENIDEIINILKSSNQPEILAKILLVPFYYQLFNSHNYINKLILAQAFAILQKNGYLNEETAKVVATHKHPVPFAKTIIILKQNKFLENADFLLNEIQYHSLDKLITQGEVGKVKLKTIGSLFCAFKDYSLTPQSGSGIIRILKNASHGDYLTDIYLFKIACLIIKGVATQRLQLVLSILSDTQLLTTTNLNKLLRPQHKNLLNASYLWLKVPKSIWIKKGEEILKVMFENAGLSNYLIDEHIDQILAEEKKLRFNETETQIIILPPLSPFSTYSNSPLSPSTFSSEVKEKCWTLFTCFPRKAADPNRDSIELKPLIKK